MGEEYREIEKCRNRYSAILRKKKGVFWDKVLILSRRVLDFPGGSDGKESACHSGTWVRSLGWEDFLEKGMATHSGTLAWKIPWAEEPGRLQSMGSRRVRT